MKNLNLCLDMYGCPNRCRHCWIGHMPNRPLSDDDAVFVVDFFRPYVENICFYSWLREPDYCEDYRYRWRCDLELSTGATPQRFELASYYQLVRDPSYALFLKELGIKKVQLTFFGMEAMTDRYVGRKGAFKELLKASDILIAAGIAPRWQAFINEDNKEDILKLFHYLKDLHMKERCPDFEFFVHEGSCEGENETLYDIRIQKGGIPMALVPYYHGYAALKTEQELTALLKTKKMEYFVPSFGGGDMTLYISNRFDVFFNFTHMRPEWRIGNLKADRPDVLFRRIAEENSPALKKAASIEIAELAARFGDESSLRLFEENDFKMYLLNQYLRP